MNLSIQQLQHMFEEKQKDSGPTTPNFQGKNGSLDKFDFLNQQIEELKIQNQQLSDSVQKFQFQLDYKEQQNGLLKQQLNEYELSLKSEIQKNKILTQKYIGKHEDCFELKKQLIQVNSKTQPISINNHKNPRPSECSTSPSPGMYNNLKISHKYAISCRSLEFEI